MPEYRFMNKKKGHLLSDGPFNFLKYGKLSQFYINCINTFFSFC